MTRMQPYPCLTLRTGPTPDCCHRSWHADVLTSHSQLCFQQVTWCPVQKNLPGLQPLDMSEPMPTACCVQEAEEELKLQGTTLPRLWSVGQALEDVGPSISEAGQQPATWRVAHSAQVQPWVRLMQPLQSQCWPSSSYGLVITVFTTVTTCVNTARTQFTAVFPVAFDSYVRNDGVFTYHIT